MAIPKVRTWKVTAIYKDGRHSCALIEAPNKRLARWNAEKAFGRYYWASPHIDKVTVSPWEDAS